MVAIKSFGDLIIALTAIKRSEGERTSEINLLLGQHLEPLFDAAGVQLPMRLIKHGEAGVPSFYDVRKNGLRHAGKSALALRKQMAQQVQHTLLFDRIGLRERFIMNGRPAISLPERENIYLAYGSIFAANPASSVAITSGTKRQVGIFPGSRLASKNLPVSLVAQLMTRVTELGFSPELKLLAGERPDLEGVDLKAEVFPRDFGAITKTVAACDIVISADSLPAHIAEMQQVPVFVFSPVPNRYWLPYSAFASDHWAMFDQVGGPGLTSFFTALGGKS